MPSSPTASHLKSLFKKLSKLKVFVVGDAMLDNYWMGNIERISPEAPVPVINVQRKESRPGGAANVALNCRHLGADVSLLTVTGKDEHGAELCRLLESQGIHTHFIHPSKHRRTTTKTRVIAKNQHVIRLDEETTEELSIAEEHQFIDTCLKAIQIDQPDILIFEDYNKGILKENIIRKIIEHCRHVGVLTAVDPKKNNFLAYQHVDLFKPNLKEVREALHLPIQPVTPAALKQAHQLLAKSLHHGITMITLSEFGIFSQQGNKALHYPAHIRQIADVSGAGDTVIAVAAMLYRVSGELDLSTQIANLAGGLVCEEVGVVPIQKVKLLNEALTLL